MKALDIISLILVIIGAITIGLVGLFEFDMIATIFGVGSMFTKVIYILIGVAGLWTLTLFNRLDNEAR